jgi:hypothetical protein
VAEGKGAEAQSEEVIAMFRLWRRLCAKQREKDQCPNASDQSTYITQAIKNSIAAPINALACSLNELVIQLKKPESTLRQLVNLFTVLGVVFQAVMLVLLYRQLKAYQEENKITKDALVADQRPWAYVKGIHFDKPIVADQPDTIITDETNSGKTPALCRTHVGTCVSDSDPQPFAAKLAESMDPDVVAFIGPGEPAQSKCGIAAFQKEQIDAVKSGKAFIYIEVRIDYMDTHGNAYFSTRNFRVGPDLTTEWEVGLGSNGD